MYPDEYSEITAINANVLAHKERTQGANVDTFFGPLFHGFANFDAFSTF